MEHFLPIFTFLLLESHTVLHQTKKEGSPSLESLRCIPPAREDRSCGCYWDRARRREGALGHTGNCPPAPAAISGGVWGSGRAMPQLLEVLQLRGAVAELLHQPQAAAEGGQREQLWECPGECSAKRRAKSGTEVLTGEQCVPQVLGAQGAVWGDISISGFFGFRQ